MSTIPAAEPSAHPRGRRRSRWWIAAALVVVLVAVAAVVRTTVAEPFRVPSESMSPTLERGDVLLVDRTQRGRAHRGEVVVFDGRGYFDDAAGGDGIFVKRVIGLGGDRVRCCDAQGRISVDAAPLDEPYLASGEKPSSVEFDVRVPAGAMFVLGDHRSDSADSRSYLGAPGGGMVPVDRVLGPVVRIIWPLPRSGRI